MQVNRRNVMLGGLAAGLSGGPALSAAKARLIDRRWARFGKGGDVDHGAWARVLVKAVRPGRDGIARFDYRSVRLADVSAYTGMLATVDPAGLSRNAAFAYWVNLYNALTVQVVLEAYPVKSIRDIGGGLFKGGPWGRDVVQVAGQALSLDDIEHGILRPVWKNPRVHYAVNCASLGCPDLAARPWTAGRYEGMLEAGAKAYVNHPRGARVQGGRLQVSSIYHWFKDDFGGTDASVITHLRTYAGPELQAALQGVTRIGGHGYDWALNDV